MKYYKLSTEEDTAVAKIIKFPGPRQERPSGSTSEADIGAMSGLRDELMPLGIKLDKTFELRSFLGSLYDKPSRDAIATAHDSLRGKTKEELRAILENSNRIQWQKRPGYFQALLDEITR